MKYNNETQNLINDNISSNEDTTERYSDEQDRNSHFVDTKDEDVEDEDDDGIDNGSLASKLLNRETCV